MTAEELEVVLRIRSKGYRKQGTSLEAAAKEISRMRGAMDAIDPRTVANRKVSGAWVNRELARLGFAVKTKTQTESNGPTDASLHAQSNGASDSGPRMARAADSPSEIAGTKRPVEEASVGNQVVAKGGA
jgi:hypothetical protein